jgi:epoxyqueuosine reductase
LPRAQLTAPRLAELATLDDAAFREMFTGSPIKRTGRVRFVRNVLIAIGNATPGDPELIEAAHRCLDDNSSLVRAAAVWAFARLAPARSATERIGRLSREEDPLVRAEWERVAPLDGADGFGDQPIDDRGERLAARRARG